MYNLARLTIYSLVPCGGFLLTFNDISLSMKAKTVLTQSEGFVDFKINKYYVELRY